MYKFTPKPFQKQKKFSETLCRLKNGSDSFVSYQLGTAKQEGIVQCDHISVALIGYHENDCYTILISTGWHCGDELFAILTHIPDAGYERYLPEIVTYLLNHYVTEEYLLPRIEETVQNEPRPDDTLTLLFSELIKKAGIPPMEPVAVFPPESREHKRLEAAAALLQSETGQSFYLRKDRYVPEEETCDTEQMWTTIFKKSGESPVGHVPVMSPKQQRLIVFGSLQQFYDTVQEVLLNITR